MTELTFSNNLLKIYTNKNSSIFSQAANLVLDDINGRIGIIYDDYDYKGNLPEIWKKYTLKKVCIVAPRRKTTFQSTASKAASGE